MSDYIDRQMAMSYLERFWDYDTVDGIMASTVLRQVKTDIMNIPSADVIEVVRCKDCTYYDPSETDCDWCSAWCGYTAPDTFCSYGERTEDKHDNNTRKI